MDMYELRSDTRDVDQNCALRGHEGLSRNFDGERFSLLCNNLMTPTSFKRLRRITGKPADDVGSEAAPMSLQAVVFQVWHG